MNFKNKTKNIITKLISYKQAINLRMNTQTQIDFRTVPMNVPSLCIPRVYPNINEDRIRKIFDELALGAIERVDIISKTTEKGEKYNRVFIHFRSWYTDGNAGVARERLLNGKDIKIIYDNPWFWKVSAYREQSAATVRPEPRQHQNPLQNKPTILFEDEDDNRKSRNHYKDQRPRPESSYDNNRRITQYSQGRQEHFQTTRPRPESGGFKKVSRSDLENKPKCEEVPIRSIAQALTPTAIITRALKVNVDTKAVEVKKEKEDDIFKQKVWPRKNLRLLAKKPILKVEEQEQVTVKQGPKDESDLEEGEIVEN